MRFLKVEVERNAPLTIFEVVGGVLAFLAPVIGMLSVAILCHLSAGCKSQPFETEEDMITPVAGRTAFPEINKWWK